MLVHRHDRVEGRSHDQIVGLVLDAESLPRLRIQRHERKEPLVLTGGSDPYLPHEISMCE
jgi:hypothetical protein